MRQIHTRVYNEDREASENESMNVINNSQSVSSRRQASPGDDGIHCILFYSIGALWQIFVSTWFTQAAQLISCFCLIFKADVVLEQATMRLIQRKGMY